MSPKGSVILNEFEKETFNAVLTELKLLAYRQPKCIDYQLITENSNYVFGAGLHQAVDWIFSKKLTQTKTTYSTFDHEHL